MTGEWRVELAPGEFEPLRNGAELAAIVTLARSVNALRFCQMAIVTITAEPPSPSITRQRVNAFFLTAAFLLEAIEAAKGLGPALRELPGFRDHLAPLFRDPRTKGVLRKEVSWLRNKAVFHFDSSVAREALTQLRLPEYVFASGTDRSRGQVYYNLADDVIVNALMPEDLSPDEEREYFLQLVASVTQLSLDFVEAADILIAEALKQMGWRGKVRSDGT